MGTGTGTVRVSSVPGRLGPNTASETDGGQTENTVALTRTLVQQSDNTSVVGLSVDWKVQSLIVTS